jgi:hypothetical protein
MRLAALLLLTAVAAPAGDAPPRKMKFWKASALALAGALAADTASSWGRVELNPLVRGGAGRFDARSFGIKAGIAGGGLALQYLLLKRAPQAERAAACSNFAAAGVLTYGAVHNVSSRNNLPPHMLRSSYSRVQVAP